MPAAPCSANARAISTASSAVHAALAPVGGRDPHRHRPVLRPDRPDRVEDLQRVAEPGGQRPAVVVGALVGQRGQEGGQQVAVRAVQLEQVEAGPRRRLRRRDELIPDRDQLRCVQLARHLAGRRSRAAATGRRPPSCPRAAGRRCPPTSAWSSPCARSGRAGCRSSRRCGRARSRRSGARRPPAPSCTVPVQPGVIRPGRGDADHLGHHQPGPAERLAAQVHEVEVAGHAVARRVHVHRRDDHPVGQLQAAQPERLEHRRPHLRLPAAAGCRRTTRPSPPTNSGSRSRRLS